MPRCRGRRTEPQPYMRVLIVKLSSLGDVVHAMPAVQDMLRARPGIQIDWVVENAFVPLVRRCEGVDRVISCSFRSWRRSPLSKLTRAEWSSFVRDLRQSAYDAVIDLQGLTKSAFVARVARTTAVGQRFAMANRTEGSSYEAPTRWLADVAISIEPHIHAVQRSRTLCAKVLGYEGTPDEDYGLWSVPRISQSDSGLVNAGGEKKTIVFAHGSSRSDKQWPMTCWIELGRRLNRAGFAVVFAHGNQAEQTLSESMAEQLECASVWPRLPLDSLIDAMSLCAGVIGVDSGLSHIAVALDRPHVQIYNIDTGWRTGPWGRPRQRWLYASPWPSVEEVWRTWQEVYPG